MATVSRISLGGVAVALAALSFARPAAADEPPKLVAAPADNADLVRAPVTMGPQAAPNPGALRAPVTMGPQAAPNPGALRAPDPKAWETAPATRRSGFVIGAAFGFGASSIVGFPADVKKIGFAPYYTVTGARPAGVVELWLGGALADWINFGLGFTATPLLATGDNKARSLAGMFHIEMFPLFHVRESLRDLGVMIDAGTGVATVTSPADAKLVDSSAASLIGGGVFWEPVKFWRFRGGPFLMGNYMWSDTARRPAIFAGWRMSFYSSLR